MAENGGNNGRIVEIKGVVLDAVFPDGAARDQPRAQHPGARRRRRHDAS